jgi:hypothetical protein
VWCCRSRAHRAVAPPRPPPGVGWRPRASSELVGWGATQERRVSPPYPPREVGVWPLPCWGRSPTPPWFASMVSRWRTCRGGSRSCRSWLLPTPQAPPTSSSGPRSVAWVPARCLNLSDQLRRSCGTNLDPPLPRIRIKMDENGMVVGRWLTDTRCYALTRVHTRFALSSGSLHKEVSRHGLSYKQEQENRSNLFAVLRSWWREEVADHPILCLGPLLGFLLRLGSDSTGLGHDRGLIDSSIATNRIF